MTTPRASPTGGALGVPYLMTMSLGRFASQRVVNLSILYVDEAS